MSYSLGGGAKMLPGQINFMTTPSGRIPNLQPLIEAGLPYAPYIEHGSWVTGRPDIARYGRDPYRGISGLGRDVTSGIDAAATQAAEQATQAAIDAARDVAQGAVLVGLGAFVGGAAGVLSGVLKRPVLGGVIGAVGGGILGYVAKQKLLAVTTPAPAPTGTAGLSGILAVV